MARPVKDRERNRESEHRQRNARVACFEREKVGCDFRDERDQLPGEERA